MSGPTTHAWVVPIVNDKFVKSALISGRSLRDTNTCGAIVAVMSTLVSNQFVKELDLAFEMVLIKEMTTNRATNSKDIDGCDTDFSLDPETLLTLQSMSTFSKLIVLHPEVVVMRQSDYLFDLIGGGRGFLMNDELGRVVGAGISPGAQESYIFKQEENWEIIKIHNAKDINWDETVPDWVFGSSAEVVERLEPNFMSRISEHGQYQKKNWIAVIGMSCRFPGANSLDEYWDILKSGRNTSGPLPENRSSFCESIGKNAVGNFLKCRVDEFDAGFFGMSPLEATFTDPQARLLLEVSWEAFEDAGINPEKLKGTSTAVFHGSWLQEYKEALNASDPEKSSKDDFMRKYLGNAFGCTAAKLSYFYGFTGENVATESGCSSSMVAVNMACQSLLRKDCPLALATGANVILQMDEKQKVLWAPDGKCKTFTVNANGYGRAEGVAVLILKRYSDAIRDNDRIHGVILGGAVCQEGLSKNFGTPTIESETRVMKMALEKSGISPNEVSYVEAHATGTTVGDPIEAAAICKAYASPSHTRSEPLIIASGKTNIGHTESVSGLAGIIKVLLALKHETIPPHLHLTQINPQVCFDSIPGKIPTEIIPWPRNEGSSRPRIAGVSSFGITGTDVHLLIQEDPLSEHRGHILHKKQASTKFPLEILALSATSKLALDQLESLYLDLVTPGNICDTTFTANAFRPHNLGYRKAFILSPATTDVIQVYENVPDKGHKKPKICFTFPGIIGSMDFTPAQHLYNTCSTFRKAFDDCNKIWMSKVCPGTPLLTILNDDWREHKPKPYGWYACILSIQYSISKLWMSWGVYPDVVLGQSMGEVAAAGVCDALSIENAFQILRASEYLVEDNGVLPGALMALGCDIESCQQVLAELPKEKEMWADVALVNSRSQTVVATSLNNLKHLKEICARNGIKCIRLNMDFAVHSRLVENGCRRAETEIFDKIENMSCRIPYVSSITGAVVASEDLNPKHWFKMLRNTVQFSNACQTVEQLECNMFIEIGLGAALTTLTLENLNSFKRATCLPSFQKIKSDDSCSASLLNSLAELYTLGVNIEWEKIYKNSPERKKISLPHYPFQRRSFWFQKTSNQRNPTCAINAASESGIPIHPLLGIALPASSRTVLFFTSINKKNVPFIYDHLIGEQVIFPGAAFMEMMMSVVNENLKDTTKRLTLNDFQIHSPLLLNAEGKLMQTFLKEEASEVKEYWVVRVYSYNDEDQWTLHASGNVVAFEDTVEGLIPMKLPHIENSSREYETFYENMASFGLRFGPNFKSLSEIYKIEEETLLQVVIPEYPEDLEKYFIHPIIIDAMIQGCMVHKKLYNKLHVPVKIGSFTLNRKLTENLNGTCPIFVHCKTTNGQTTSINLLTTKGSIIASMENLSFVSTNVDSVLKAAGFPSKNTIEPLPIYEITWEPSKFNQPDLATRYENTEIVNDKANMKQWLLLHDVIPVNQNDHHHFLSFMNTMAHLERNVTLISIQSIWDKTTTLEGVFKEDMEGIIFWIHESGLNLHPEPQRIVEPILFLSKYFIQKKHSMTLPKFLLVTRGCWQTQDDIFFSKNELPRKIDMSLTGILWGFMRTLRMELPEIASRSIDITDENDCWTDLLIHEIWLNDNETEICYRDGERLCRRLKYLEENQAPRLLLPVTMEKPQFTIEFPESKIISHVKYSSYKADNELPQEEVEIEVHCSSLNFKDVLTIIASTEIFEKMKMLGLEYSGIIKRVGSGVIQWKVGDAVFGFNTREKVVASHTSVNQDWLVKMPQNLTFLEAASLPTVFITAWYCMVNVARLKSGETILIHAASGGVGLVAIQIAKYLGVNIIGTAGSRRKRSYLRSIGVELVFNSRNTEFCDNIRQAYQGILQPVDMVLNCLTGPGFKEASLDLIRDGGHFVEISKLDIWSEADAKELRPLVSYKVVNAMDFDKSLYRKLMQKLTELLHSGSIKPLPSSIYHADEIVSALQFLQKAKHIGKVILELPRVEIYPGPKPSLLLKQQLFNEFSTYFISGGAGSLGIAVAKWMISQGAKYLVLGGRSPLSKVVKQILDDLEKNTLCKVVFKQIDISDYGQCEELFVSIHQDDSLPPIRGIHHCSGILSDQLIANQTWENFEKVLSAKVMGAWNLHTISTAMELPLEFFVLYSSMCCTFGNLGQSNYTAANAYMDSLAEMRRRSCLPALSINWGKWEVGLGGNVEVDLLTSFSLDKGIQTLEKVMTTQRNTSGKGLVAAGIFNARNLLKKAPFFEKTLLENVLLSSSTTTDFQKDVSEHEKQHLKNNENYPKLKEAYWKGSSSEERSTLVYECVIRILCETLGVDENEVEEDIPFSDMGMDSLMAIEFTNKLLSQVEDHSSGFIDMEENNTMLDICQFLISFLERNTN